MGVVNVFLGGSGKYIAEELKGQRAHYELPLPDVIACDLSREATHTGVFALGHDLLAPHEQFAATTMDKTVPAWAKLDAGEGLAPELPQPGPGTRPEAAVMRQIAEEMSDIPPPAEGLWGLRAAGLLAFATFMSPGERGGEVEAAQRFKQRLNDALLEAGKAGSHVTVNIVASTAGGTGAGMFLPLAWHIRDLPGAERLEINLVLIASSAFDNEPLDQGVNQLEMRSKGRTGTFAIIRELEALERADSQTSFPDRRFLISTGANLDGSLRYRLGSRPFHRVYWMGRRGMDGTANKVDVYRETDLLVRILSNTAAADDLDGASGTFAQRLLPSVVTVDYPRLARARKLSSALAEAAIQGLIEGDDHPISGRRLFEYPGDDPMGFGKFSQDNENRAFAVATRGDANTTPGDLDNLVKPYTDVRPHLLDFVGIPVGTARARAGYASADDDWGAYCVSLSDDLKGRWTEHERHIDQRTRERIDEELSQFRKLVVRLAHEYLRPDAARGPYPLKALRTQVLDLKTDLDIVRTFFGHKSGFRGRLPEGAASQPKYDSIGGIRQRITAAENAMRNPEEPHRPGGLTLVHWLLVLLAAVGAGAITWVVGNRLPALLPLWSVVAVVAAVTAVLAYAAMRSRASIPLPELRRREERRLFTLYEDRVFAHTAQRLWRDVNESFIPGADDALDALQSRAEELNEVYNELLLNARARASEVFSQPLHSVGQVGTDLAKPDVKAFVDPLKASVALSPFAAADRRLHDLQLKIGAEDGDPTASGSVRQMADAIREQKQAAGEQLGAATPAGLDLTSIDAAIDAAATTALAQHLPRTFEDALRQEAGDGRLTALDQHLAALVHKTPGGVPLPGPDRRRSAVDCASPYPTVKRLYVPSVEVQALVVQSMQGEGGTLAASVRNEFKDYMGPGQLPLVVPELGASIALLSLWVPDGDAFAWSPTSIMATPEGQRAHDAYYGLALEAKAQGFIGQKERNFHILPELSAAAEIEVNQGTAKALRACVVARLLGSHPKVSGPTLIELFYLLRADDTIRQRPGGDPIKPRELWEVRCEGQAVPLIEQPALAGAVGEASEFGGGRRIVNAFDAFHEFMLYDGAPAGAMAADLGKFVEPGAGTVQWAQWAEVDKAMLASVQRALVTRWWRVESRETADSEYQAMRRLLDQDIAAMDQAEAAEDWNRAVDYVLGRGSEKRRALAAAAS